MTAGKERSQITEDTVEPLLLVREIYVKIACVTNSSAEQRR